MKTLLTRSIALAALAGSLCFTQVASAAGTVSYYGYQLDTPGWRSTSVTKTITTPGGPVAAPSNAYGVDGYQYVQGQALPSYISGFAFAPSSYALAAYQPIDNPTLAIAPSVLPQIASSLLYQNLNVAGVETASPLGTFTVGNAAPASFLMGIAFGNFPLADGAYLGQSFRVAVGASTTGQISLIGNNGLIDWVFFKVDGATLGDQIQIFGTSGANGYTDLAAVSFDTIPEPGTYALLGLAGFGLALHRLRRRRRTS
jgi:PEP-CTERM motif